MATVAPDYSIDRVLPERETWAAADGADGVAVMCATELLAARAAVRGDRELLADALSAMALYGFQVSWIWESVIPSATGVSATAARSFCMAAVRGRDRRLLRARGRATLRMIIALAAEGVLRDRETSVARDDYWRRRMGA